MAGAAEHGSRRFRARVVAAPIGLFVPVILAATAVVVGVGDPSAAVLVDGHLIGDALATFAAAAVAGLVLARVPGQPVGRVFAVVAWSEGVSCLASALAGTGPPTDGPHLLDPVAVDWVANWSWVPGLVLLCVVLPLVFPIGVTARWQRLLLRLVVGLLVVVTVAVALGPTVETGPGSVVSNPLAVPGARAVSVTGAGLLLVGGAVGATVLLGRLLRADLRQRRQIAPFVVACAIAVAVVVTARDAGRTGVLAQDLAALLVPLTAGVCVLWLHLWDIEVAVRRTVTWVVLAAGGLTVYVVAVRLSVGVLRLSSPAGQVLATVAVVLAVDPLRRVARASVLRWLYGDARDPFEALARTGGLLAAGADPTGALRTAAGDLARRLRCPSVVIRAVDGTVLAGVASGTGSVVVPLFHGAARIGALEVAPRGRGETYSAADRRLIAALAVPIASAVAAISLTAEVRNGRERLVRAGEEERRRIRTSLHDDIGPSLAAVSIQASTALIRLRRGAVDEAAAALTVLQQTSTSAVSDLRHVLDGLRPSALDELGLVGAVRHLCEMLGATADVPESLPPLPAAVEVAAHRVIAEALTNAVRHAAAEHITVTVGLDGRGDTAVLVVEIADDGVGIGSRPGRPGLGTASMRERVDELGGVFAVTAGRAGRPGTTVRARFGDLGLPSSPGAATDRPSV